VTAPATQPPLDTPKLSADTISLNDPKYTDLSIPEINTDPVIKEPIALEAKVDPSQAYLHR
jgi:hypothetical protein